MTRATQRHFPLLACLVLAVQFGCGASDLPLRAPVTGIVTFKGEPLADAIVTFVPDKSKGTEGPMAVGATDAEGRYVLSTDRREGATDGATVGFHRVRITANRAPTGPSDSLPSSRIPMRYNNPAKSGLVAEVKSDTNNKFDFQLDAADSTR